MKHWREALEMLQHWEEIELPSSGDSAEGIAEELPIEARCD